jgi:hypothetical protein
MKEQIEKEWDFKIVIDHNELSYSRLASGLANEFTTKRRAAIKLRL